MKDFKWEEEGLSLEPKSQTGPKVPVTESPHPHLGSTPATAPVCVFPSLLTSFPWHLTRESYLLGYGLLSDTGQFLSLSSLPPPVKLWTGLEEWFLNQGNEFEYGGGMILKIYTFSEWKSANLKILDKILNAQTLRNSNPTFRNGICSYTCIQSCREGAHCSTVYSSKAEGWGQRKGPTVKEPTSKR